MPFTPLNPPEETEHDIEKHIREVELEQALRVYQEALKLHYQGLWQRALILYEEVLASEILADAVERDFEHDGDAKTKVANQIQSSMAVLPYLIFKNHASLLLSQAANEIESHDDESLRTILSQAVVQYATALTYDGDDLWLWKRIGHLCRLLGISRSHSFANEVSKSLSLKPQSLFWDITAEGQDNTSTEIVSVDENLAPFASTLASNSGNASQQTCMTLFIRPTSMTWYGIGRSITEKYKIMRQYSNKRPIIFHIEWLHDVETSEDDDSTVSGFETARSSTDSAPAEYHIAGTNLVVIPGLPRQGNVSLPDRFQSQRFENQVANDDASHKRKHEDIQSERSEEDQHLRASKRVRERKDDTQQEATNVFFDVLRNNFAPLGISFEDVMQIDDSPIELSSDNFDSPDIDMDFKLLLYNDWEDMLYVQSMAPDLHSNTHDFPRTLLLTFEHTSESFGHLETSIEDLKMFVDAVNTEHFYCESVMLQWVLALTRRPDAPYLAGSWQPQLRSLFWKFLFAIEQSLYTFLTVEQSIDYDNLYTIQAILELCIDEYAESERARIADTQAVYDAAMYNRILSWLNLASSCQRSDVNRTLSFRWRWSNVIFAQICLAPVDHLLYLYREFATEFKSENVSAIHLPNCHTATSISIPRIEAEIRKLSTMDFFNLIFSSTDVLEHEEVLLHLEPVLASSSVEDDSPQVAAVRNYLSSTPADFQLQLWSMLVTAYRAKADKAKIIYASCCNIRVIVTALHHKKELRLRDRQILIISSLYQIHPLIQHCSEILRNDTSPIEDLSLNQVRECIEALIPLCALLQTFLYFEDHTETSGQPNSGSFERFAKSIRESVVISWLMIYLFYRRLSSNCDVDPELLGRHQASFLSSLHDELGTRGYCSLCSSWMLELFEDELFRLNRAETEPDLIQIFHCKYERISFAYGLFTPWVHHSTPSTISDAQALKILPFITTFLNERSPGILSTRADLRQTLEELYEISWKCIYDTTFPSSVFLDEYLNSSITPWAFRGCTIGRLHPQFPGVCRDLSRTSNVAWRDLAYNLARISLSQYRQRNKALVKGRSELEDALNYLQIDLLVSPERQESWQAMASLYAELADDDLSWNAQQINDQIETIVSLQRKCILSYMMALSLFVQKLPELETASDRVRAQFANLLYDFAFQLYSAAHAPGSMAAFHYENVHYEERGQAEPILKQSVSLEYEHILKLASRCFSRAALHCSNKWRCTIMLGKCHEKLKLDPVIALNDYSKAIELAPSSISDQGPLLEPHYRILSSIYKFLSTDRIDAETAVKYLASTSFAKRHIPTSITKHAAMLALQSSIRGIKAADKKHWQHRPIYRLSMISRDLDQPLESREELESLFTARGSGNNLLNIWRPDLERPGRHFIYTHRYAQHYADILFVARDMDAIRTYLKRFRRATSSILHHKALWSSLCIRVIQMIIADHAIIKVELGGYIDILDSSLFIDHANKLESYIAQHEGIPAYEALREFYELRKLNGGLFETGKLDDVIIDAYMMLYESVPRSTIPIIEVKKKKETKVSRKEILGKAFSLCKPRTKIDIVAEVFEELLELVLL